MPTYDYECSSCGRSFEASHAISDKPKLACPSCSSADTRKVPSLFYLGGNKSLLSRKGRDRARAEAEARQDLRENYGVENVCPIAARSFGEVYSEIKKSGGHTKEYMQSNTAQNEAKRKEKAREWKRKAILRTPARAREMQARKAAEEQAKRRIVL